MKIVYNPIHEKHNPQFFLVRGKVAHSAEQPERASHLLRAVSSSGHTIVKPDDFGESPAAAVHSARYLAFLKNAHQRWSLLADSSPEILPHVHPPREESGYPRSIVGQAGFHIADTSSPIGPGTWGAALGATHSACHAARLVLNGDDAAYCLSRPPGHHATRERAGGFCYLNSTAVAAQWLRQHVERVAILDVDVHHGNGTQDIFYDRADVLHVSLHADPHDFYPFFTGYECEIGKGEGTGYNINVPLPLGTSDAGFLDALRGVILKIQTFKPSILVVALGLDASENDPLHAFNITREGFGHVGEAIGGMRLPTALIQEGGYLAEDLGANLLSFLTGFAHAHQKVIRAF